MSKLKLVLTILFLQLISFIIFMGILYFTGKLQTMGGNCQVHTKQNHKVTNNAEMWWAVKVR